MCQLTQRVIVSPCGTGSNGRASPRFPASIKTVQTVVVKAVVQRSKVNPYLGTIKMFPLPGRIKRRGPVERKWVRQPLIHKETSMFLIRNSNISLHHSNTTTHIPDQIPLRCKFFRVCKPANQTPCRQISFHNRSRYNPYRLRTSSFPINTTLDCLWCNNKALFHNRNTHSLRPVPRFPRRYHCPLPANRLRLAHNNYNFSSKAWW